jgi:hypothetical protein
MEDPTSILGTVGTNRTRVGGSHREAQEHGDSVIGWRADAER